MAGVAITGNGNSEWISLPQNRNYRVTVEATTWGETTSVKFETASESGLPIVVKSQDDSADWEATENDGCVIAGPGRVRAVTENHSGTEGMILRAEPTS